MKYLRRILKHKWYVAKACLRVGLPLQALTHDLSKLSPKEFLPSARYFDGSLLEREAAMDSYAIAWLNHKARNRHHWEYWTSFEEGRLILERMPPKYLAEMLCDWIGAGKAYESEWSMERMKAWYEAERPRIFLHASTQAHVDMVMRYTTDEKELFEWIRISRIEGSYLQDECVGVPTRHPWRSEAYEV